MRRRTEPSPGQELVVDPSTHRLNLFPDTHYDSPNNAQGQIFHDAVQGLSNLAPIGKLIAKEVSKAVSTYINKPVKVPTTPPAQSEKRIGYKVTKPPVVDTKRTDLDIPAIVNTATAVVSKLLPKDSASATDKAIVSEAAVRSVVKSVVNKLGGDYSKNRVMGNNKLTSRNSRQVAKAPVAKSVRVRA